MKTALAACAVVLAGPLLVCAADFQGKDAVRELKNGEAQVYARVQEGRVGKYPDVRAEFVFAHEIVVSVNGPKVKTRPEAIRFCEGLGEKGQWNLPTFTEFLQSLV